MKLDILVFAVHPDDAELGCSGTIIKHINLGYKVGLVDLTRGELGTRGTVKTRDAEAAGSAKIMGLTIRENLGMRDGFFKNDEAHQLKIITTIRKYQPDIVIANAYHDRHPDHGRACNLVTDATFYAGLSKIETHFNQIVQDAWRPGLLLHFIQDSYIKPDVLVDITDEMPQKMLAIKAFKTQFYSADDLDKEVQTYISSPEFLEIIKARAKEFGKSIGAGYAEGFTSKKLLGVGNLFHLK